MKETDAAIGKIHRLFQEMVIEFFVRQLRRLLVKLEKETSKLQVLVETFLGTPAPAGVTLLPP